MKTISTTLFSSFPTDADVYDRVFFDTENGCLSHTGGQLTSWFRRTETGWQVTEWAAYMDPDFTGPLCDFLATFQGEGILEIKVDDEPEAFPITLIGDPDHAAKQADTVNRLLRRKHISK